MREDYTDINVVLDRSGSMQNIARDMEGGFNQLIKDQQKVAGKCLVSFTQFDSDYTGRPSIETLYAARPVYDVPEMTLIPRGGTPLLDAVGTTIVKVGERLRTLPASERPARVLFIVITDGGENTSREYKKEQVKRLVERQRAEYNWQFLFLGANIDSFAEAGGLGMASINTANYAPTSVGTQTMWGSVSSNISSYRGLTATVAPSALEFTKEQRLKMEKPDEVVDNSSGQ